MKKVRKGWILAMTMVLLSALLPAWASQSFSAVKLPTESVKKGGAASDAFLAAKGVYSSWENANTGFTVDAQYGFYPAATEKTKMTVLGQTSSKAFQYIQGITGHLYGMTEETYAGFDARTAPRGKIGWKGTDFKIYNTTTGRYDKIDIKVTITDWEAVDNPAYLFLQTSNARPSFNMWGVMEARIRMDYFKAGTEVPYVLSGNYTFNDIDSQQYMGFSTAGLQQQYVSETSRLLYEQTGSMNLFYEPTPGDDTSGTPDLAAGATYRSSSVSFLFGNAHLKNEKRKITWAHYGFYSNTMVPVEPSDPVKEISDGNEQNVRSNTLDFAGEAYTYHVRQHVPGRYSPATYFHHFAIKDQLEPCLEVKSVAVLNQDGKDVSDWFDLTSKDHIVTATAKNPKSAAFYEQTYELRIDVCVSSGYDMSPYRTGDGITIPNKAEAIINDQPSESNEVTTSYHEPGLEIEKTVDHEERQVGQEATYTVKVRQTKDNAAAANVIIRDLSLPEYLPIRPESIRAEGVENCNIRHEGNGWVLTAPRLSYGEEIRVLYTAGMQKEASGKEVVNTATVQSDEVRKIQAQARVRIKDAPDPDPSQKQHPEQGKGNTVKKSNHPDGKTGARKTASADHIVKTGDEMPVMSLIVIMAIALMAGVMTWIRAKK